MKKKLQVFISSTFTDLIVERQAAVSAILKLGHIPAGMELFTANDKSQWETIRQWIDESDVYMLILGGRYGSVEKDSGVSYTEKEFNYAIQVGKPLFSVVIKEDALEAKVKDIGLSVIEKECQNELRDFRARVLSNMSSFYEDVKDIKICIMESLPQISSEKVLSGWVSGKEVTDVKNLVDEIGALSNENTLLRKQLANEIEGRGKEDNTGKNEFPEMLEVFKGIIVEVPSFDNGDVSEEYSLLQAFRGMVSGLVLGVSERFSRSNHEIYVFNKVCPMFELYGLVVCESVPLDYNEMDTVFKINDKGREFAKFINKETLLGQG